MHGFMVDGRILANGQELGGAITKISAYVQQENLFIGTLTVREHIHFQARFTPSHQATFTLLGPSPSAPRNEHGRKEETGGRGARRVGA